MAALCGDPDDTSIVAGAPARFVRTNDFGARLPCDATTLKVPATVEALTASDAMPWALVTTDCDCGTTPAPEAGPEHDTEIPGQGLPAWSSTRTDRGIG